MNLLMDKDALAAIKEDLKQQLFYCESYACTMTKHACYSRRYQLNALQQVEKKTVSGVVSDVGIQIMQFKHCIDCKHDWPDNNKAMAKAVVHRPLSGGYYSKRTGPKPKPVPEHCPICDRKINQKSLYFRYVHKHEKCNACLTKIRSKHKEKK